MKTLLGILIVTLALGSVAQPQLTPLKKQSVGMSDVPDNWCPTLPRRVSLIPPKIQDGLNAMEWEQWETPGNVFSPASTPLPTTFDVTFTLLRITQVPDAAALAAFDVSFVVSVSTRDAIQPSPLQFDVPGVSGPAEVTLSGSRRVVLDRWHPTFDVKCGGTARLGGGTPTQLPAAQASYGFDAAGEYTLVASGSGWQYELSYVISKTESATTITTMSEVMEAMNVPKDKSGANDARRFNATLNILGNYGVTLRQFSGDKVVLNSPEPLEPLLKKLRAHATSTEKVRSR